MRLPDWLGFRGKTLWDWLQLLIVPAILIAVTFAWSATQTRSDNKREDKRIRADGVAAEEARQDGTLKTYLDQMSGLMLKEKLLDSKDGGAVRAVARTVTLTTLRRLNESRKGEVVRFLHEAQLLRGNPRVYLAYADLRGADLRSADLRGANLESADLRGANLGRANLGGANLMYAQLRGANLGRANLGGANLEAAQLQGADLSSADLLGANLDYAHLRGADLDAADLWGARLLYADLNHANLRGANFSQAILGGAHLNQANLAGADLATDVRGVNLLVAKLNGANLEFAQNLDLGRLIAHLAPERQKAFLDSQKAFLDSLSPAELAKFNLTPEKLAKFRREANGG